MCRLRPNWPVAQVTVGGVGVNEDHGVRRYNMLLTSNIDHNWRIRRMLWLYGNDRVPVEGFVDDSPDHAFSQRSIMSIIFPPLRRKIAQYAVDVAVDLFLHLRSASKVRQKNVRPSHWLRALQS